MNEIAKQLRIAAQSASKAAKMVAGMKTDRNRAAGETNALYVGCEPHETLEWLSASEIERLDKELGQAREIIGDREKEITRLQGLRRERLDCQVVMDSQQIEIERLRATLEQSVVAIDDWLNLYASDMCNPERVSEAEARVHKHGTLWYIADVQQQNRAALGDQQRREAAMQELVDQSQELNMGYSPDQQSTPGGK